MNRPRRLITMDDLNYVIHRSTKNIINFPSGAKIPGCTKPLTDGEVRVLAIIDAVLSMADKEADVVMTLGSSDSINEQ